MSTFKGNVAIVAIGALGGNRLFEPANMRDRVLERFKLLRDELAAHGISCRTADEFAAGEIDVLIFHDIMNELDVILTTVKSNPELRLICLPNEPPYVLPLHDYRILPGLPVDLLLTWNDRIAGKFEHVRKLNIGQPDIDPHIIPSVPFTSKKFISTIFAYKPPRTPGSIFSERLNAIDFFSRKSEGIDLYGVGWEAADLSFVQSSYRGPCDNKLEVQQQYRFSIAFENSDSVPGYITEKLFDCFAAGTVPVYLGAPNVKEHIPSGCFIALRDFRDYEALYEYLSGLSESDYQSYLDAARDFLETPQYYRFTTSYYAEYVRHKIENLGKSTDRRSPLSIKWSLFKLIICHPGVLRNWHAYRRFVSSMLFRW